LVAVLEMPELNDELTRAAADRKRSDSELLRAKGELERAEANRELVELSYSRLAAVTRSEPGLIARQELDEAIARKRSAEAQVAAARAALSSAEHQVDASRATEQKTRTMLDYARITAPFAGMITKRYTDPGAMIQTMPLLRLAEISRLRLVVPVPESQVPHIAPGTPVEIRVSSLNRVVRGIVARFTGDVQMATRTMDVEVDVPNADGKLVPGMYADAVITLEKRDHARSIPVQALVTREGKRFVMVVRKDNTIQERALQTGIETAERLEVVTGVESGELVIVSNKGQLKEGQRVEPKTGGVS
jgi:RND family efflux transporter MFP subunit